MQESEDFKVGDIIRVKGLMDSPEMIVISSTYLTVDSMWFYEGKPALSTFLVSILEKVPNSCQPAF